MQAVNQGALVDRMIRASKGDVNLYEEVERDETATQQAVIVVGIVALASAIGAAIGIVMLGSQIPAAPAGSGVVIPRPGPIGTFITTLIAAYIGWLIWAYTTYFVGTRMFGGTATPGEMLRTIGFAQSPRVLGILSFIPVVGALISLLLFIWSIYLGFVAVRQGLDLDNQKAIFTIIISAIVAFVATIVIGLILAPLTLLGI
jgi:hypothetical protein